ncbi:hypothetical protein EDI_336570 [Entamoeba dispar SAW760]|uniref:Uncharacterized protein n=1 Tax=Entamoeba dispar (strain ATCC PRA-260 / SAW760) TaxID=370354 RepID=B0ERW2_ENTDS|nr:uncharacterized protein EDI_336570 [Entamoeba dispar SAW760]EDR22757.1 hypothetical protein EDI_336570 [Entamoeba dispar SAW760]|eukprot:EDR22757.1 hypothetical protein EDI_336570 [Entamoeba dispar SAW760]
MKLQFNDLSTVDNFNEKKELAIYIHIKDSNSIYDGIIQGEKSTLFCKENGMKLQVIESKGKIMKGFINVFKYDVSDDRDIIFKFNEAFGVAKTKGTNELHLHFEKSSDCYEGYATFPKLEDQNTIERITAYNLDFFIYFSFNNKKITYIRQKKSCTQQK